MSKILNTPWKSLEFTIGQANKFIEEHPEFDSLPNNTILIKLGYVSLSQAICKYYGGFPKFREVLGQENKREPYVWKSLNYTIEQAKKFMHEYPEFDSLPSSCILKKLGYLNLLAAIIKYHGGINRFRGKLRK